MNTMTQDSSTGLWNNKNRKIFFWSILALAVILRCIRFATVPDGINQDEATIIKTADAYEKGFKPVAPKL